MIETFTDEVIAMMRHLNSIEREQVCCGTVTVQQCHAMQLLAGKSMPNSDLAAELGSSPSAMTRLVDGLIKREWAERVEDSDDRRRALVQLTDTGEKEASRLRGLTETAVADLLAAVPKGKHKQVLESVRLIRTALDEVGFNCC